MKPNWEYIARAFLHPTKAQVIDLMSDGEQWSPKLLSRKLGGSVAALNHHIRALEQAKVVELVGTAQRRGAVEHFYVLVAGEEASTP